MNKRIFGKRLAVFGMALIFAACLAGGAFAGSLVNPSELPGWTAVEGASSLFMTPWGPMIDAYFVNPDDGAVIRHVNAVISARGGVLVAYYYLHEGRFHGFMARPGGQYEEFELGADAVKQLAKDWQRVFKRYITV
jgi:hypothetical protein